MNTKIAIKSDNVTPFGGIFYAMDEFSRLGMNAVIDESLGLRSSFFGYQYSEIISSLFWVYYCGGDHIEDIGKHLGSHLELRPNTRIPSPDTLLRGIKELSVDNIIYPSSNDSVYEYNTFEGLNELLLKLLLKTKQLEKGKVYDFDFDHEFVPTEKYDTVYSYKKKRGYFPGVATIGDKVVSVENRVANANVRFHQGDTLKRCFSRLEAQGITINRARMDCGSFSQEIIRMVEDHSYNFYIRAARCESLYQEITQLNQWQQVEINFESYEVTSILFKSFMEDCHYRLVIQRQKRSNGEKDLFQGEYTYRCILSNDWERTEEEIIKFYNDRGASEKTFDQMNNDFGWKYLPCSFMKENTVFLLLTAMAKNFYTYLIHKISEVMDDIEPVSRLKKFVFRFISVPAKWIKTGRTWVLNLYTNKPYNLLWDS